MTDFMEDLILEGEATHGAVLLAHGAGAGSDSPFIAGMAALLVARGFMVARFDFDYMARARREGRRRPPDRAPVLLARMKAARAALSEAARDCPIILAGKSMGGRMATLLAAQEPEIADAVLVFGYPFHPPGKSDRLRVDHFPDLKVPTLICQGERDPFGGRTLVDTLELAPAMEICWLPDGDHDLKPRKKSGFTHEGNMKKAADSAAAFLKAAF